jgi:hypothetical protein
MNICGSVAVLVDVCFVTASQIWPRYIFEICYAIKFCVKLGQGATNTYDKIQKAFGNDSVSRAQVFLWRKDFVNGWKTVEDEPRSERPATVITSKNVDRVRAFVRQDRRLTIRMIGDELNINECTGH